MTHPTKDLVRSIQTSSDDLRSFVRTTNAQWDQLLGRLDAIDSVILDGVLVDEQVWTFLMAVGYAAAGPAGMKVLNRLLTGDPGIDSSLPVWFEVQPVSPRKREGNTHLDLAAGTIGPRIGTKGGIELGSTSNSWVCFVEAKWFSDLSYRVTNHPERNQLARVIENGLAFQSAESLASSVYVTLLTPGRFRSGRTGSRLYRYKYEEYRQNPENLLGEFGVVDDGLPRRHSPGWQYPDMTDRIDRLTLNWVTFEDLVANLPRTPIGSLVGSLADRLGDSTPATGSPDILLSEDDAGGGAE